MKLRKGSKFISTWFKGLCVVDVVNEEDNDLEVLVTSNYGQTRREHWNLLNTLRGFEAGSYETCCEYCTDLKGQNIGNMYRCLDCGRLVS